MTSSTSRLNDVITGYPLSENSGTTSSKSAMGFGLVAVSGEPMPSRYVPYKVIGEHLTDRVCVAVKERQVCTLIERDNLAEIIELLRRPHRFAEPSTHITFPADPTIGHSEVRGIGQLWAAQGREVDHGLSDWVVQTAATLAGDYLVVRATVNASLDRSRPSSLSLGKTAGMIHRGFV